MTTLVFGAGFLGKRLATTLSDTTLSTTDICDGPAVARELQRVRPVAVINAAGKTGRPTVDWCESHPMETARSNVTGPISLASACAAQGIYLLHLGSGCVFYGPSPSPGGWREDDFANPVATYSRTKYAADLALGQLANVGIARLRMPVDYVPGPRNLITKLAGYRDVIDVENSVTVVEDLLAAVARLVETRSEGVFHVTNPGTLRHRDLLRLYREHVELTHEYTMIEEDELVTRGLVVKPRSNCILQDTRLARLGIHLRPIDVAILDTMKRYASHYASARV
jgi:3,5-epimerase/4-reductase